MTTTKLDPQRVFTTVRTYEPYSEDPDYIASNRTFVERLNFDRANTVLDLACGIGTLGNLALARKRELAIVGLDLSYEGLVAARQRFASQPWHGSSEFRLVNATADAIPLHDASIDAVMMGHSIHMPPDEDVLLGEIARVLRSGGWFAFNTSFYAGTFVPGTETIYHDWTKEALSYIRAKDEELRSRGEKGIRRRKGTKPAAFSKPWLTPEEWREKVAAAGFSGTRMSIRTVPLTQRAFESIGAYAGFATVLLSGYPVDVACEALQAAAGPTLDAAGVEEVPRDWLEVVCERV